ncbi:zinc-binding dehydrogenase [Massilia sp. GCM10020059]|uniref:Zinc-binding dehydrogenase n=1 Tax=Massilia agrisoli TaxID=2892444 RepID=A0ABS8IT01_9BURK|nr:zinc-binding dehydrogenase [Massilia agrisoli]MCC6070947.1 zinc-binding dehydrogenase [Massilia agrisoli]
MINAARVQAGTTVAVLGLGGVELCAMLGALAAGARHVTAIDLHDSKVVGARSLGATATVNARDPDAIDKVKALTGGDVDYAFEMAGSVHAMEAAYRMTRRGGMTVTAGSSYVLVAITQWRCDSDTYNDDVARGSVAQTHSNWIAHDIAALRSLCPGATFSHRCCNVVLHGGDICSLGVCMDDDSRARSF